MAITNASNDCDIDGSSYQLLVGEGEDQEVLQSGNDPQPLVDIRHLCRYVEKGKKKGKEKAGGTFWGWRSMPTAAGDESKAAETPSDGGIDTILENVTMRVERGKITALIGPSGSGKSTLLRAINRLWEPAKETVWLGGEDITTMDVISLRRRVGMLFQTPNLFDGTVADNIRYGPSLRGVVMSGDEIDDLLHMVDLDDSFAERSAGTLSGGQAQRVALARALANSPDVLLLDEPTSALDPSSTLRIEAAVRKLCTEKGIAVVWVSHSAEQVLRVADVAVLLVGGRVVDTFRPEEIRDGSHELATKFVSGELTSNGEGGVEGEKSFG